MAKKIIKPVLFTIAGITGGMLILCLTLQALGIGRFRFMPPVPHKDEYTPTQASAIPPRLQVDGNQIVNEAGEVVRLRGVMIPELGRLHGDGRFNQELVTAIQGTGANVVRVPVHPEYWHQDRDYLWRYLDPFVTWAGDAGLYVIIDWHYIGNIATGAGEQMPDIDVPPQELTMEFWQLTAGYFRNASHVIFEIFNEPESIQADVWRSHATEIIQLIRDQGANQVVIVGGIDFGRDLSWVVEAPVAGENIAYASHIYPVHSKFDYDRWFGNVAEAHPVLITEWGFMDENRDQGPGYLAGDELTYGKPLLQYLDEHQIGWVGCWYDDVWAPSMLTEGWNGYTRNGEFILRSLNGRDDG